MATCARLTRSTYDCWSSKTGGAPALRLTAQMRDVEHDAVGRMKAHVLHLDLDVSGSSRQGQAGSAQQSHRTDEAHTMPHHGTDFGRNAHAAVRGPRSAVRYWAI
jgi:hypothetical protein